MNKSTTSSKKVKKEAQEEKFPSSLFIIAAASGSGKTSLVDAIIKQDDKIKVSVSYTTRAPRENEHQGEHYFFVTESEFKAMIEKQIFLEYAEVFECYYGTSKDWVMDQLRSGIDVILEIDWQGAKQVRELFKDCVSIFVLPPSYQTLRERLQKRNQDSIAVIEKRLEAASHEIAHCVEFDYLVVNDNFKHALHDLQAIIQARRLIKPIQEVKHRKLLEDLMQRK